MSRFYNDETQDDLIFGEDEDIHEGIKLSDIDDTTLQRNPTTMSVPANKPREGGKRDSKNKTINRTNCTEAWLAARFEQLMSLDLVELPDNYYEDKLFFDETDALDQKFSQLEEDNLFYIHRI